MIGQQIRKYRIEKGYTQEKPGQLIGVTTQAVPLLCFADEIAKDDVHPFFGLHDRKKPFF